MVKPLGHETRGFTAPNRLRLVDTYVALEHAADLRADRGVFVDLGYGAEPRTTLETFQRLRRVAPGLEVVGVELDRERVAAAQPMAREGLSFRYGGFDFELPDGQRAAAIRAMNVLRQYDEADVGPALAAMARSTAEGGLLFEGTSTPSGALVALRVDRLHSGCWRSVAVVFAARLDASFDPLDFRAVLTKRDIHHADAGSPIDRFFRAWERAWLASRTEANDPRRRFIVAARELRKRGYAVDQRTTLLRRGFLVAAPGWPAVRA